MAKRDTTYMNQPEQELDDLEEYRECAREIIEQEVTSSTTSPTSPIFSPFATTARLSWGSIGRSSTGPSSLSERVSSIESSERLP